MNASALLEDGYVRRSTTDRATCPISGETRAVLSGGSHEATRDDDAEGVEFLEGWSRFAPPLDERCLWNLGRREPRRWQPRGRASFERRAQPDRRWGNDRRDKRAR